jgi:hypothetical protein
VEYWNCWPQPEPQVDGLRSQLIASQIPRRTIAGDAGFVFFEDRDDL